MDDYTVPDSTRGTSEQLAVRLWLVDCLRLDCVAMQKVGIINLENVGIGESLSPVYSSSSSTGHRVGVQVEQNVSSGRGLRDFLSLQ